MRFLSLHRYRPANDLLDLLLAGKSRAWRGCSRNVTMSPKSLKPDQGLGPSADISNTGETRIQRLMLCNDIGRLAQTLEAQICEDPSRREGAPRLILERNRVIEPQ